MGARSGRGRDGRSRLEVLGGVRVDRVLIVVVAVVFSVLLFAVIFRGNPLSSYLGQSL